ncbi:MAG: hypothetical protein LOD94_18040, partial [Gammaproteobacteria bacterium]
MTLQQLIESCQLRSAEVTDAFFTPEAWKQYINLAQNEFARETKVIERVARTMTIPGERAYPLDPDFYHIDVARWGDNPVLQPISVYDMESRHKDTGTPTHFLVRAGRIFLWPTPNRSEELVVWYFAVPRPLDALEDEPEIPIAYHDALIPGACYFALKADKDYTGANLFKLEWEQKKAQAYSEMQEHEGEPAIVRDEAGYHRILDPWGVG